MVFPWQFFLNCNICTKISSNNINSNNNNSNINKVIEIILYVLCLYLKVDSFSHISKVIYSPASMISRCLQLIIIISSYSGPCTGKNGWFVIYRPLVTLIKGHVINVQVKSALALESLTYYNDNCQKAFRDADAAKALIRLLKVTSLHSLLSDYCLRKHS